ncbi:hypothetical protein CYMTET_14732 [Cymbomonas tetramitiformis]|uniref:Uncharacterized protein n=1 Tax=Cymbomonas tetramitiformis TaxID=36881 RepID=A0AAE0L9W2_9CHLO|nr:hypothetical protein CYMTET_14732 [Cymbomonas tetramitiformis]
MSMLLRCPLHLLISQSMPLALPPFTLLISQAAAQAVPPATLGAAVKQAAGGGASTSVNPAFQPRQRPQLPATRAGREAQRIAGSVGEADAAPLGALAPSARVPESKPVVPPQVTSAARPPPGLDLIAPPNARAQPSEVGKGAAGRGSGSPAPASDSLGATNKEAARRKLMERFAGALLHFPPACPCVLVVLPGTGTASSAL